MSNHVEPYEPPNIREAIETFSYKPGWDFWIGIFHEGRVPLCWAFYVVSDTENSMDTTKRIKVRHEFLIPPASYKLEVWKAWMLDRVGDVEMHERNEFARWNGEREFAPHHGNGEDPYRTWFVSDYATAKKRAGDE